MNTVEVLLIVTSSTVMVIFRPQIKQTSTLIHQIMLTLLHYN